MKKAVITMSLLVASTALQAEPTTYKIDPNHTYPAFEADHMGGLSNWRGKINSTTGTVSLDKEAQMGTVDITMDMSTIDFGHEDMNEHARSEEIFHVEAYPNATYKGSLVDFEDGVPTAVDGNLTLHGVTKPVRLTLNQFLCKQHPMMGKEVCGADASATINRDDFGVDYAKNFGFDMETNLSISVEAVIQ